MDWWTTRRQTISPWANWPRTGVRPATLRTWETRYGFPRPRPRRGPGGHRRYRDRDVGLIEQVLRLPGYLETAGSATRA